VYFTIYTKIPFIGGSGYAPQVRIHGYGYNSLDFDTTISWYEYGGVFYNPGTVTKFNSALGTRTPSRIRLGVWNDSGTNRIAIEVANDSNYWTSYTVDLLKHYISVPVSSGWTTSAGAFPGGITNIVAVPQAGSILQNSSGNVGIGTTAPGSALDVKGALRLSGSTSGYVGFAPAAAAGSTTYTLPSADGGNGQVLTTNGAGALSWSAMTSGSVTSVGTGTGLTGGPITSSGTISVDVGTTAGKIPQIDSGGRYPATTGFITTTKDNITTRTDGGFYQTSAATIATGWPVTTNNWYHLMSSTHTNDGNYFSMQFAGDFFNSNELHYRATNNNGTAAWNKIYHSGNLTNLNQLTNGPGYITGISSANVTTALGYTPLNKAGDTATGVIYFQSNKGAASTLGANSSYSLEAYSSDGGAAAMSFHRSGAYAVNMGLDPDNVLRIGGWSAAANRWQLDMSGNETIAGSFNLNGNITFANANPTISSSSYFVAPGGAYFNSGTVYTEAAIQARGGIHNDTASYLTLSGGTSGATYFSGNVGVGTTAPAVALDVNGGVRAGSSTAVTTCGMGAVNGEGTQRYNYTTHNMEYCNGTGWVAPAATAGNSSGGACTTANQGQMSYNPATGTMQVCNGSSWATVALTTVNWSVVANGGGHSCGITAGGALYCWGYNATGEVGVGTVTQYKTPQQVGALTNWTAIAPAAYSTSESTCGIAGGALYCWGYNGYGNLGTGNSTNYSTPQQIGAATNWTVVSNGGLETCGIAAGALYCWGYNGNGDLGLGDYVNYNTPQQVGALTNWSAVSTGHMYASGSQTCGIAGGALYCWGYNGYGGLGLGNTTQFPTPQQVGSATNWTAISVYGIGACGVAGGNLYCWGHNGYGQLGLGNVTTYYTPQQVGALSNWTQIVTKHGMSGAESCGIAGGALYCWGYNGYGQLGLGNVTTFYTPQQVGSATNWTSIISNPNGYNSFNDFCGVAGGVGYCWGYNGNGQHGTGDTTQHYVPTQIGASVPGQ
jgi:hypothetical protein